MTPFINSLFEWEMIEESEEGVAPPPSITRAKTFFGMNPVTFVDDVVCAVSTYIQNASEAMSAKLLEVKASTNHKYKFERDLKIAMQESINRNSDLFELYVLRNIFHVDVDVDLASAITRNESTIEEESSSNFKFTHEDGEGLDERLEQLYKEIHEEQVRSKQLAAEIKANQAQLEIYKLILKRLPAIRQLADSIRTLPTDDIDRMRARLEEILERTRSVQPESPEKSLAFHKGAFIIDPS